MPKYNYLIVGSGLFGSTFAYRAKKLGKKCLVIDCRKQIGGNIYCENVEGINVHKYGAHIFHTNNKQVWDFVNSIVEFNRYTNSPVANYKGTLYNLPFNMNTFYQMWGVTTPTEAKAKIEEQKAEAVKKMLEEGIHEPRNLEEQAITLIGKDIYEKLIKGYTEKQWGRKCTDLPAFIIKRLPVRFVYDNNYFNDKYQGIPIGGYNKLIDGQLDGIEVRTGVDFLRTEVIGKALLKKSYLQEKLMNSTITDSVSSNTVRYDLKKKSLIAQIIREMQLSTILKKKFHIPELLSTNILRCLEMKYTTILRLLFQKNILQNGKTVWNLIIL